MTRSIVFLPDFGFRNESVGVCHAVIDKVAPGCRVGDLSHGIPHSTSAREGLLLADSLPFIRHDAIALAVVDPSVGRDRDIVVEADDGRLFVGPDAGLLSQAWRVAGGVRSAVPITSSSILLEPVSPSFHARDVLAPAAAHLALGAPIADLDLLSRPEALAEVRIAEPLVEPGKITCHMRGAGPQRLRERPAQAARISSLPGLTGSSGFVSRLRRAVPSQGRSSHTRTSRLASGA
jgi:hypothetical protein